MVDYWRLYKLLTESEYVSLKDMPLKNVQLPVNPFGDKIIATTAIICVIIVTIAIIGTMVSGNAEIGAICGILVIGVGAGGYFINEHFSAPYEEKLTEYEQAKEFNLRIEKAVAAKNEFEQTMSENTDIILFLKNAEKLKDFCKNHYNEDDPEFCKNNSLNQHTLNKTFEILYGKAGNNEKGLDEAVRYIKEGS
jgi:hypothetical protein